MKVVLLHNPTAGREAHSGDDLVREIQAAGHEVVQEIAHAAQLGAFLRSKHCDLVAVAGGDGTIGRALLEAADSAVPVALLPLGTANNIARTLGYQGDASHLVRTWPTATRRAIDLVALAVEGRPDPFVEGAGFGVFPELIRCTESLDTPAPEVALECHLTLFRSIAERHTPRPYSVTIDGVDHSGSYLLAEVMNLPLLGPNVPLAAGGTPSDGLLEIVLVGEDERSDLLELLRCAQAGKTVVRELPTFTGREITILAPDDTYHVDGSLRHHALRPDARNRFEFLVQAGAVEVLTA